MAVVLRSLSRTRLLQISSSRRFISESTLNSSEEGEKDGDKKSDKNKKQFREFRDFLPQSPQAPAGRAKTPVGKLEEIKTGVHPYAEKNPLLPWPDGVNPHTGEVGGPKGPEPTRYGDWERKGRVSDF